MKGNKVFVPMGERVFVILDAVKEGTTSGGIIVPDKHSEQTRVGTVMAIGDDVTRCKAGDRIAVSYMAGTYLHFVAESVLDDTHRVIMESNILGHVNELEEGVTQVDFYERLALNQEKAKIKGGLRGWLMIFRHTRRMLK